MSEKFDRFRGSEEVGVWVLGEVVSRPGPVLQANACSEELQ